MVINFKFSVGEAVIASDPPTEILIIEGVMLLDKEEPMYTFKNIDGFYYESDLVKHGS